MPVFAVIYEYLPAHDERRLAYRPQHRQFLTTLNEQGTLLAGGAWQDNGTPGALLVARGPDRAAIETVFDADPYYGLGVLGRRNIRPWAQLFGPWSDSAP